MKRINSIAVLLAILVLAGCNPAETSRTKEIPQGFEEYGQEFKGKIAQSYEESQEWWPEKKRPPADAPNVIIFLLDDVGWAQVESFG